MMESKTCETNPIIITTVGKRLKTWRKHSMLKLVELSKKVHISQGSLSDLENDKSLPSSNTLANFCKFSDINISWLLIGRGSMIHRETKRGGENKLPDEYANMMHDRDFKELIEIFVRIYLRCDADKRAYLENLLEGANINNS
jgi:transcriptional regulator with XRE-family HTH domain